MLPLLLAEKGSPLRIGRITGKEETKRFLENLGFSVGEVISVVNDMNGSLIVKVKDSRIALGKDVTGHILVSKE
ncbi:MAG: ferrous iron transport protein A [Oxalobacter sp.]